MNFVAEHAFYAMVDLESKKFIKNSEIRKGSAAHVDHGNPMDVWMFFREFFGEENKDRYLPMFIHTHPIGASFFSGTDMATLESFSGLVSPMKMAMQVVTEEEILTRIGWMESNEDFKIRKDQDKSVLRNFYFKQVESQKLYDQNSALYDEIRKRTYQKEKESLIRRIFRLGRKDSKKYNSEDAFNLAERMKDRGFLKDGDF